MITVIAGKEKPWALWSEKRRKEKVERRTGSVGSL